MKPGEQAKVVIKEEVERAFGLPLSMFLSLLKIMDELRELLGPEGLYTERAVGLMESTQEKDPLDCKYIRMALHQMSTKSEEFKRLKKMSEIFLKEA